MGKGELRVGGITPLTTIDYPGELAAVIFCQGCPWHCRYCHNPELLPPRGEAAVPWEEALAFLRRRRGLLDAVVFSGGEPTLQVALADALKDVRALGFKVGLHSAGIYPRRLVALLPSVDWVGLDVKALAHRYPDITGVPGSGEPAWQSARLLIESGVPHEMRITVDPALTRPEEVRRIAARLQAMGAERVVEQPRRG
ncbi:Ribonucleotide reductase of class III (anaerobic), activating protein [Thioalkalivibrio nitratireducens DSM 14787]|uniref:Ribonucleotide reductase of class III (Anaerobic), activating protein n=1 Tax=Thioalkalivibrio nitratireducens (strain DSM 14787 / UNIQEM 213 / ALEN2) TaxID=1255043 RepID=L0DWE0_THIND|nr:anaerobic ribonucleoside-triphosphate reductase activating protein [Thioalkalivibrio nitratireducens]AGA33343.1 Ribonucleotide reductase of class III (anaerobic), activating protein [Thioalkalivibrio nitratireducens DSM 14787]